MLRKCGGVVKLIAVIVCGSSLHALKKASCRSFHQKASMFFALKGFWFFSSVTSQQENVSVQYSWLGDSSPGSCPAPSKRFQHSRCTLLWILLSCSNAPWQFVRKQPCNLNDWLSKGCSLVVVDVFRPVEKKTSCLQPGMIAQANDVPWHPHCAKTCALKLPMGPSLKCFKLMYVLYCAGDVAASADVWCPHLGTQPLCSGWHAWQCRFAPRVSSWQP